MEGVRDRSRRRLEAALRTAFEPGERVEAWTEVSEGVDPRVISFPAILLLLAVLILRLVDGVEGWLTFVPILVLLGYTLGRVLLSRPRFLAVTGRRAFLVGASFSGRPRELLASEDLSEGSLVGIDRGFLMRILTVRLGGRPRRLYVAPLQSREAKAVEAALHRDTRR